MGIKMSPVSSGSACTSATLGTQLCTQSFRSRRRSGAHLDPFRFGPLQTPKKRSITSRTKCPGSHQLRELSPLYEMAKEGIDISKVKWQTA